MKIGLYPGSFDPVTYGHLDVIKRACKLFDKLIIAIMKNPDKSGDFTVEERKEMLEEVTSQLPGVEVVIGDGLTVELAKKLGAVALVRGIRAVMDYEYELQLATTNMILANEIETVFFLTRPEHSFLSSSMAKEVARNGGNLKPFLPDSIASRVKAKYNR
ncbi:MAG: pantetheine-phosphate adenylyltransferase [Erysipelotrichaceae bacterium]|jgi:pantetheine-phosphate adenylyltransferase|nr:pantetheine-phosphate adenylyltransferase [Erysipelotrichaceae bacterium]